VQGFSFAFVVEGLSIDNVEQVNAVTEECEGVTLAELGAVVLAVFEREADSAENALATALRQVEAACSTVQVLRLDPDLVSVADIAQRTGRTRQSVRMLADGHRGPGDFPQPVGSVGKAIRVWEWASVDEWLRYRGGRRTAGTARAVSRVLLASGSAPGPFPSSRDAICRWRPE
jgi:predicted DNA-binding transcriptional regulator AlpA